MSDPIEYTDGNYVSLSIEELPYERADENDYHLKFSELSSQDSDGLITVPSSMGLKGVSFAEYDEFPLDDNVPLLVAPVLLVPKTKRRRMVVKKQKKKTKKNRNKLRSKKRALRRPSLRSV
jgi:hypothetical protein